MTPGGEADIFFKSTFNLISRTKEMQKLKGGFLIKEMLDRFTQKAESKLEPDRSLWIYSGHDTTIAHFLNSFGLFDVGFLLFFFKPLFFIRSVKSPLH